MWIGKISHFGGRNFIEMSNTTQRVLHVCQSDCRGGAAIAALRLVEAQRNDGVDARMLVLSKSVEESWIEQVDLSVRMKAKLARILAKRALRHDNSPAAGTMRTLAFMATGLGKAIAARSPDLVHLHWLGGEAMSLGEFAALNMPVVWTCHDQWAFCGTEHYAPDDGYRDGYRGRSGLDADVLTWRRKKRAWRSFAPLLACPSHWMAEAAVNSDLAGKWPVRVIPNTLDTGIFCPVERAAARRGLGLPDGRLILFGADSGDSDPRKGYDLLLEALGYLPTRNGVSLVTFGGGKTAVGEVAGMPCHSLGKIGDPRTLAGLYSAADLLVVPSRADNLPNTMLEALCCGTPCVGFDVGGLRDIVSAPHLGELVPAFDTAALARGIDRVFSAGIDQERIRNDAVARYGHKPVAAAYSQLYLNLAAQEQGLES